MIRYELAGEADDAELRALLRDNGMPSSWVDISLEREPCFFAGMNQVTRDFAMIARDGDKTVGMYSCSLQPVHINGQVCTLGYLGGLRVSPNYRNRLRVVRDGYASIPKLTSAGDYPFWFTSVASENAPARRLLETNLPGMPRYYLSGEMSTLALPVSQGRNLNLWRSATETDIPVMIDFHNREAARFQYAPILSEAWIRYIGLKNFLLFGDDSIEACLAIWDQSGFKQVVARGYSPAMQAVRPWYNFYATLANRVRLPAVGQPLSQSFLAFSAFSEHAMERAFELVRDVLARCNTEAAVIGLHKHHPLLGELKTLKPLIYRTRLYAVSYADKPLLDSRPVQPEAALL